MKARLITTTIAAMLIATCLIQPAAAEPAVSGGMSVTVTVGTRLDWRPVDANHIELRSNTPWMVVSDTRHGVEIANGGSTRGVWVKVEIPKDASGYSVTPNR